MATVTSKPVNKIVIGIVMAAMTATAAYGIAMVSSQYQISQAAAANSSANASSANYSASSTIGQAVSGAAQSSSYSNSGGVAGQAVLLVSPPAANMSDAYVYPNPFKPNSPGRFQAARMTFKNLPQQATIRVFSIAGKEVAELHKTDTSVDYYEWDAVNFGGQKLASGVYIFYMTSPGGGHAKGKFAIIR
jgi:hypothetical protein